MRIRERMAEAKRRGRDAGQNAASWVFDGNTSEMTYTKVNQLMDDGDPSIDDVVREPNWLSGEWAGESISELLGDLLRGDEYHDEDIMEAYANAASSKFWHDVEANAAAEVG